MKFLLTEAVPDSFLKGLLQLGIESAVQTEITQQEIIEVINQFDGLLIRGRIKSGKELIGRAERLKYILRPGSGLDIIDIDTATEKGIHLINSPEGNRDAVAEHAVGMLISLLKEIPRTFDEIKKFNWIRKESQGHEIMGKTIGIVGFGNTGSAFAKRLRGFNVQILAYDKNKTGFGNDYITESPLETIFEKADIVSFHIPLNKGNEYLVNKSYLEKFAKPIYLINTSRGKILETADLIKNIQEGRIKGACLDVLENENFSSYKQQEKEQLELLLTTGKIIITPHIAGKTIESEEKIHMILLDKLKKLVDSAY